MWRPQGTESAFEVAPSVLAGFALLTASFLASPPLAVAQDDATCTMCHGSVAMFQGLPEPETLVVTPESLAASVHGQLGLSCVMCHQDLMGSDFPHAADLQPAKCDACHAEVSADFAGSFHGYALARGNPRAPDCATCHGDHDILRSSDPRSKTHRVRLPSTCAECHGAAGVLTDQLVKLPQTVSAYAQSVHGQGVARGVATAASCSDCHGIHNLLAASDPASRIHPSNVSATCGQCHPNEQLAYDASIHGRALKAGIGDSPSCVDCHGEHLVLSPQDPEATTTARRIATETCGKCHNDPLIISKYNLQGGVVGSYVDSYHGWAARRGDQHVATCVSCHTAHSVLPEADSASSISTANVVATCAQCHPDADMRFAASYTHEAASITANPINRIIRLVYLWAIGLIIGGMVLHNLVIMNYYVMERRKRLRSGRWIRRLDRVQILQHLLLTVSFVMLVITGFALRYPEAWWVTALSGIGMTETVRGDLHRIFGVVLILTALLHLYYVMVTRRGRVEFRAIVPAWRDLVDLFNNLLFHTWRRRERVKFGRYDYTQKAEYWALVWGTALMAITGLALWFPILAVKVLPVWIVPAAQTVHFYEAWLATLAIIVWHFFFVIFHPDVYPMSWTWLTGKMSAEEARHHHTRWYEEAEDGDSEEPADEVEEPVVAER